VFGLRATQVSRSGPEKGSAIVKDAKTGRRRRTAWTLLIMLCVIACAVALRRGIALAYPPASYPTPDLAVLDAHFAAEPRLTYAHIIPAFLFAALVSFQFAGWIRERHPAVHRWNGRILITAGTIAGVTAVFLRGIRLAAGSNRQPRSHSTCYFWGPSGPRFA
jgi:hypothetical protein